jgi:galactokinase
MDIVDLRQLDPVREEREHSASLIRGIAAGMRNRGHAIGGLDIYTTSRVPKGSVSVHPPLSKFWSRP